VISILVNLALIPVVMFYLLHRPDAERLFTLVPRDCCPRHARSSTTSTLVLAEPLRGQLMVMPRLAVYYAVALTLWGSMLAGRRERLRISVHSMPAMAWLVLGVLPPAAVVIGLLHRGFAVYAIGQLLEGTSHCRTRRRSDRPRTLAVIFALLRSGSCRFAGRALAYPRLRCCWSAAPPEGGLFRVAGVRRRRGDGAAHPICGAGAADVHQFPSRPQRGAGQARQVAQGEARETARPAWAPPARRSHLLQCRAAAVSRRPSCLPERERGRDAGRAAGPALVAVDDVDRADGRAGRLFTLYNRLQDTAAALAAGQRPASYLCATTRGRAWAGGPVYEVLPLPDDAAAPRRLRLERGFRPGDLTHRLPSWHGRRDMPTPSRPWPPSRYSLARKGRLRCPCCGSGSSAPWRSAAGRNDRIVLDSGVVAKTRCGKIAGKSSKFFASSLIVEVK
jgi:hypothetical protein